MSLSSVKRWCRHYNGSWESLLERSHKPENTVDFIRRAKEFFDFKIQTAQTDNGTEFSYHFIIDEKECLFDTELRRLGIAYKLIKSRTPWHNGKVERSHRPDQRYFYDWEMFCDVDDLKKKLAEHLVWSNNRRMRTLGWISPAQKLANIAA